MLVHRAMIPSALMTLYPLDCSTSSLKHILLVPYLVCVPISYYFVIYIHLFKKNYLCVD